MSNAPVLYEKTDAGVGWITLNRPHVLNAMNMAVRDDLWVLLQAVRDDPDVRVCVIAGNGDRGFSAGADISEFGTSPSYTDARRARRDRDLWGLMLSINKPFVSAVHGFAFGAGCELPLLCDIRIASEDATFALPEVTLGYIPSAGGTQTLPRTVPPGIAREMIYGGAPIDATRALRIGLVTRVVPRAQLRDEAAAVGARLAALRPDVVAAAKAAMLAGAELPLARGLRVEAAAAARLTGAAS